MKEIRNGSKKKNFLQIFIQIDPCDWSNCENTRNKHFFLNFQHKALRNFLGLKLNAKSGL